MARIYHVSQAAASLGNGSEEKPFRTIQQAAELAVAGDTILVHEGVYREWVRPRCGGLHDNCRITYQCVEGEHAVIKGSEHITGWEKAEGDVWFVKLPNELFGAFNPYAVVLDGDWFVSPREQRVHCGDVYMNGKSFYEAASFEEVCHPKKRLISPHETWGNREEKIINPEDTLYQWYAEVEDKSTVIYANFQGADPNKELVEVNVRKACFFPETTGINYITVRGFEMAHAATQWAPPTAEQLGLLGTNWSFGWVIEENDIHDSKCSGISLGKEAYTGNNDFTRFGRKPGYQYQMEAVFKAAGIGWSKERIGSHIVRNNKIHDCGQNGIVGHMGCAFSEIYGNEIFRISTKHEYYGHELGGIKFHAAIDTYIHNNYIHHCSLGTWLDWQAQGVRVSANIYDSNNRDFMIEVTHGPYLVDNNIFMAEYTFDNAAQGGAYVNNLCCGFLNQYPILNRATPYHFPHSTQILGTALVYGSDDRWYQNIFIGGMEEGRHYGTESYNGAPISMEEYIEKVKSLGYGDVEQFERIRQPAYIERNVYLKGARAFDREGCCCVDSTNPGVKLETEGNEVYLEITLPEEMFALPCKAVSTEDLGMARISEACFENRDGSRLTVDRDLLGLEYQEKIIAGPLQKLKPGRNRIRVWQEQTATENGLTR